MHKAVAIIMGSTRPTRISLEIAKWAKSILNQGKIQYDIIDLKNIDLPFLDEEEVPMTGKYNQEHTKEWSRIIQSYDGIIFLFPQYNWGYPAVLKNAIDYLGNEWNNKPTSCITYGNHGGTQGYASMLLVMNCLKMQRMAVNPAITINADMFDQDNHFKNIDDDLNDFKNDIELLRSNFENNFNA